MKMETQFQTEQQLLRSHDSIHRSSSDTQTEMQVVPVRCITFLGELYSNRYSQSSIVIGTATLFFLCFWQTQIVMLTATKWIKKTPNCFTFTSLLKGTRRPIAWGSSLQPEVRLTAGMLTIQSSRIVLHNNTVLQNISVLNQDLSWSFHGDYSYSICFKINLSEIWKA